MKRFLLARAVALVALAAAAGVVRAAEEKLVGYWRFDEGQGLAVRDSSGNGRDGRILNDGRNVKWVEGRNGMALEFVGGDPEKRNEAGCVEIPNVGDCDWSKGVTVEMWVKFTSFERNRTYELVSTTFGDRGKGWRLILSWEALRFVSGEGGQGRTWGAATRPAQTKLQPGVWYHIAATYDSGVFRIYLDGQEVGVSEPNLEMTPGRPSIYIGAYNGGYAYGLNGVVDDVKVYNRARTPEEIMASAKMAE